MITKVVQNNTLANDTPIFLIGTEFFTQGTSTLNKYTVNSDGEAALITRICGEPQDTSIKEYDSIQLPKINKILYKIISIKNDDVIVEIYLDSCEIHKKLNKYYCSILKEKNIFYEGAEFYVVYEEIQDGMSIRIELLDSYFYEKNELYDFLYNELIDKC